MIVLLLLPVVFEHVRSCAVLSVMSVCFKFSVISNFTLNKFGVTGLIHFIDFFTRLPIAQSKNISMSRRQGQLIGLISLQRHF